MTDIKATDLPVGSVVAARFNPSDYDDGMDFAPDGARHIVFVRQDLDTVVGVFRWVCGLQGVTTSTVQRALGNGAVVLRVGEQGASTAPYVGGDL